jgi:hypothetical protein
MVFFFCYTKNTIKIRMQKLLNKFSDRKRIGENENPGREFVS